MISHFDNSIKRYLSVFFRLLIVFYCITILYRFENHFNWYIYLLTFSLYLIIYFLCFGKDGKLRWLAYLRLINDYALFFIVLYGKEITDLHTLGLLVLPIINSLNHSGKKKIVVFSLPMYGATIFTLYLLQGANISWWSIIALISFSMVSIFFKVRVSVLQYVDKLNTSFEDYDTNSTIKPYELLGRLLDKFDNLPPQVKPFFFKPKEILCFRLIKNKLYIKSSTNFILNPLIEHENQLMKLLKNDNIVFNKKLVLDGSETENNVFIKIQILNNFYVFVFLVDSVRDNKINRYFIEKFLKPALIKVGSIINYENKIKGERRNIFEKYKSKFKTLEETRDTLHHIKNKLLPVYGYFDLMKRGEEKGKSYESQLLRFKNRIPNNLASIKSKSDPYLEGKLNPYSAEYKENISLKRFYKLIIDAFNDETELSYSIDVLSTEGLDREVNINVEGFEFLLSELTMNIEEHSVPESLQLLFSFDVQEFNITFVNEMKDTTNAQLIAKLFNKDEVALALESNFNGLTLLKRHLLKLEIAHELIINNDKFCLKLKIETHESSNN